jgi:hypothetical protein
MCLNMGNKKARVLPLPVLAMPIKSRPDMIAGIAWTWMGVGFSKPSFFRMFSSLVETPHWAQVLMGLGQPFPATKHVSLCGKGWIDFFLPHARSEPSIRGITEPSSLDSL